MPVSLAVHGREWGKTQSYRIGAHGPKQIKTAAQVATRKVKTGVKNVLNVFACAKWNNLPSETKASVNVRSFKANGTRLNETFPPKGSIWADGNHAIM